MTLANGPFIGYILITHGMRRKRMAKWKKAFMPKSVYKRKKKYSMKRRFKQRVLKNRGKKR
jgi:hypothetical protein